MSKRQNSLEFDMQAIGANIQKHRRLAGLTQEQLAERTGCSASNLGRIETGNSQPSFRLAIRIANELNVSLDQLYLCALNNKTDYYVSEIIRLMEPYNPERKERILRMVNMMLEIMEEEIVRS